MGSPLLMYRMALRPGRPAIVRIAFSTFTIEASTSLLIIAAKSRINSTIAP